MPQRLKQRQEKIKDKRKQTPWREFVKEIASWRPITFSKVKWKISRYPETNRIENLSSSVAYEDMRDGLLDYGLDNQKSFFKTLGQLFKTVPKELCFQMGSGENTDYADVVWWSRNVYLSNFIVYDCENVCYSMVAREHCVNIFNSLMIFKNCDNVYSSVWVIESYNIFYSRYIKNSSDIWFSKNLIWCTHCIWCSDLENKSYCIQNKQYNKEEYFQKYKHLLANKWKFSKFFGQVSWEGQNFGSNNVTGNFVIDSEEVKDCHLSYNLKKSNKVIFGWWEYGDENFVDVFIWGAWQWKNIYAVNWTAETENVYCSTLVVKSSEIYYSFWLDACSYCFGCIGLKNKSYCILNKQYTKEERYDKVDEIFTQMEKDWTLWKFFPWSMNPFYFNDTAAYLIDDTFTKEEVEAEGYLRRDEKIKVDIPEGAEIVYTENPNNVTLSSSKGSPETSKKNASTGSAWQKGKFLDDYQGRKVGDKFYPISEIWNKVPKVDSGAERWINPEILKKVIQDEEGNCYRIVKLEYDFLMKHGLPLPRLHWLDRIKLGFRFK